MTYTWPERKPPDETLARQIAFWHGQKIVYRDPREGPKTVAAMAGYGNWGHSPDKYSSAHWQDYTSCAEFVESLLRPYDKMVSGDLGLDENGRLLLCPT